MSYEGTVHKLCKNGHYSTADAMTEIYGVDVFVCAHCNEKITHEFSQDQTNGDDPEYPYTMPPDMTSFLIEEAKGETCNLGHFHMSESPRYRVPDNGLWRELLNT